MPEPSPECPCSTNTKSLDALGAHADPATFQHLPGSRKSLSSSLPGFSPAPLSGCLVHKSRREAMSGSVLCLALWPSADGGRAVCLGALPATAFPRWSLCWVCVSRAGHSCFEPQDRSQPTGWEAPTPLRGPYSLPPPRNPQTTFLEVDKLCNDPTPRCTHSLLGGCWTQDVFRPSDGPGPGSYLSSICPGDTPVLQQFNSLRRDHE